MRALRMCSDDDDVNEMARHFDALRVNGPGAHQALDLRDHDAAAVPRGSGQRQRLHPHGFALDAQVAHLVSRCCTDQRDVDRKRLVQQPVASLHHEMLDKRLRAARVHRTTFEARVHERVEPHVRQHTRVPGGNRAVEQRNLSLRQVPAFALRIEDQLAQAWRGAVEPADHLSQQSLMREVIESVARVVALRRREDEANTLRGRGVDEALPDRLEQLLGSLGETEPRACERVAISDERCSFGCGQNAHVQVVDGMEKSGSDERTNHLCGHADGDHVIRNILHDGGSHADDAPGADRDMRLNGDAHADERLVTDRDTTTEHDATTDECVVPDGGVMRDDARSAKEDAIADRHLGVHEDAHLHHTANTDARRRIDHRTWMNGRRQRESCGAHCLVRAAASGIVPNGDQHVRHGVLRAQAGKVLLPTDHGSPEVH